MLSVMRSLSRPGEGDESHRAVEVLLCDGAVDDEAPQQLEMLRYYSSQFIYRQPKSMEISNAQNPIYISSIHLVLAVFLSHPNYVISSVVFLKKKSDLFCSYTFIESSIFMQLHISLISAAHQAAFSIFISIDFGIYYCPFVID